jgi:hypothetical protein
MTHYRRDDESNSEFAERVETAQAHASRWFADLTKPQGARFNNRMAVAAAYKGAPRWDRAREAALREFKETTAEAAQVSDMVQRDMLTDGEISEATSYAFDECAVQQNMLLVAAEYPQRLAGSRC